MSDKRKPDISIDDEEYLRKIYELEISQRVEKTKCRIISDSLSCGIWEYDIASKTLQHDKKLDGRWSDENLSINNYRKTVRGWGLVYADDIPVFEAYCDSMDNGDAEYSYDFRVYSDNEKFEWMRYTGAAVYDNSGKAVKSVGKTISIESEMRKKELESRKEQYDPLTGLICGKALEDKIKSIIAMYSGSKYALIYIDIDNFKSINEGYGHVYGDYILESISGELRRNFSADDVIGRIRGDEFMVLVRNIRGRTSVVSAVQNVMNIINSTVLKNGMRLTASIGVSIYPDDCVNYDSLNRGAELAVSKAKASGKNKYIIYSKNDNYHRSDIELFDKKKVTLDVPVRKNENFSAVSGGKENKLFDYALNILTESGTANDKIDAIISEIGRYYDLYGVFVVESAASGKGMVTHYWADKVPKSSVDKLFRDVPKFWHDQDELFADKEYVHLEEYSKGIDTDPSKCAETDADNTEALIYPIIEEKCRGDGHVVGVIVFSIFRSNPEKAKFLSDESKKQLQMITKMVTSNIIRVRNQKQFESDLFISNAILDNQRLQSYGIDCDTYELLYITEYTKTTGERSKGRKCYEIINGINEPCNNCPVKLLKNDSERHTIEYFDDRTEAWYSSTASTIILDSGQKMRLICRTDVSQFVEHIRSKDKLTGIMTMDRFETEAMKILATRTSNDYAVIYLGFKKFNNINEEWGYSVGDSVLKIFASRMSQNIGENELFARINSDNFLMFVESTDIGETITRIHMIIRVICQEFDTAYPGINAYVLGGAYKLRDNDWSIETCIDNANIARKSAKNHVTRRENEIVNFDEDMQRRISLEKEIEASMFDAVSNHEFKVYIQPKVDISTHKIKGAEALCRWIRADNSFFSPTEFIHIFEENGFITELDFYIYQCLCDELRKLLDNGILPPVISVNVSRAHLISNNGFVDKFCSVIDRYRIPHRFIELELTETMFFDNLDRLLGIINDLHSHGFQISIDDFGSGYSSLNLIKVLPVDVLKIDGEFFKRNKMTAKDKAVISTIFRLARDLKLKTVAEGIETEEQMEFVTECGCDMIQGYYFYKPMPIAEFESLIEEQNRQK